MKALVLSLLAAGWACASDVATAATLIDERLAADGNDTLVIRNVSGSIRISGGSSRDVHVTGSVGDGAELVEVSKIGDRLVVTVAVKDGRDNWRDAAADLVVEAPQAIGLEVEAVSASIDIRGIEGEQRLSSVSGSVRTQAFEKELQISSVSGAIDVEGQDRSATLRARAVSGSLTLTRVSGEIRAESVSGPLVVDGGTLLRGEFSSVSGSILVRAALANDARIQAMTTSGGLRFDFAGAAAAQYELASFAGEIDSCFGPDTPTPSQRGAGSELRFQEGDSDAQVRASSMSGSITLCRE